MQDKPVILLDVDGVVNAVCAPNNFPTTWLSDTWTNVEINGFPIQYSSSVVDRLNALSERAEIRWHTTWRDDAPELGRIIGLNEFVVADHSNYDNESRWLWWKQQAALDVVLVEKRPLIWIDDDINQTESNQFWAKVESLSGSTKTLPTSEYKHDSRAILIRPNWRTGLTDRNLNAIESFIEKCEASGGSVES